MLIPRVSESWLPTREQRASDDNLTDLVSVLVSAEPLDSGKSLLLQQLDLEAGVGIEHVLSHYSVDGDARIRDHSGFLTIFVSVG